MTELSFLLDLLLLHKLPKATREAVATRIKEVEATMTTTPVMRQAAPAPNMPSIPVPPHLVGQSPSTIAAMLRHEQAGAAPMGCPVPQELNAASIAPAPPAPQPVVNVAQTPAAMAAMNARAAAVNLAISGKPVKGETSPRKW